MDLFMLAGWGAVLEYLWREVDIGDETDPETMYVLNSTMNNFIKKQLF